MTVLNHTAFICSDKTTGFCNKGCCSACYISVGCTCVNCCTTQISGKTTKIPVICLDIPGNSTFSDRTFIDPAGKTAGWPARTCYTSLCRIILKGRGKGVTGKTATDCISCYNRVCGTVWNLTIAGCTNQTAGIHFWIHLSGYMTILYRCIFGRTTTKQGNRTD